MFFKNKVAVSLDKEISEVLEIMGRVFYKFGLVSDVFSIFSGRYQLPIAPAIPPRLVSGWLKVSIRTDLLPIGVFLQNLQDVRLITALRSALGRNVESYLVPVTAAASILGESAVRPDTVAKFEFWYFIEMDHTFLRSIPRFVHFDDIPVPPSDMRLPVPFGLSVGDTFIWLDFTQDIVGLLLAGATRTGKSVFLRALLTWLAKTYPPAYFSAFIADFKFGVEFGVFADDPHFINYSTPDEFLSSIRAEMERRFALIKAARCLNIFEYNDKGQDFLPYSIVCIDELTHFKMRASKGSMDEMILLVSQSAGAGLYWLVSNQRPSVDIAPGSLKANLPARASFSQASTVDYDVVFGEGVITAYAGSLGQQGRQLVLCGDRFFECQSPYI